MHFKVYFLYIFFFCHFVVVVALRRSCFQSPQHKLDCEHSTITFHIVDINAICPLSNQQTSKTTTNKRKQNLSESIFFKKIKNGWTQEKWIHIGYNFPTERNNIRMQTLNESIRATKYNEWEDKSVSKTIQNWNLT